MRLSLRLGPVLGPLGAALLLAAALPLADGSGWLAGARSAAAQSAPPSGGKAGTKRPVAKSKSKDATADGKGGRAPAETDRVLDSAAKSLAEGNADAAMTTLDGVLAGGGLANNHMARALYLRGLAHRKKSQQAQAIADLTSAIWVKGGLSDADRTAALAARGEISREIGVADAGAPASSAPASSAPVRQPQAAPTGLITRAPTPGSSSLSEGGFPRVAEAAPQRAAPEPPRQEPVAQTAPPAAAQTSLVTRAPTPGSSSLSEGGFPRVSSETPPRLPSPTRASSSGDGASPSAGKATSSWQSGTTATPGDGGVPPEERQKSSAAAPAPKGSPSSGGGLGQFFSGLFGSAPASSPPQTKPATKSAEAPPWSTSVQNRTTRTAAERPPEKSAAVVTSAVPPSSPTARGAYRLQIAALRSRREAEAVAARVRKEHGGVIGAHKLEVDETVFGNMGTFYRVRIGPIAAADESKAVCDQLRTKGYDCLVVTQ
jgi:hypothetical protein